MCVLWVYLEGADPAEKKRTHPHVNVRKRCKKSSYEMFSGPFVDNLIKMRLKHCMTV